MRIKDFIKVILAIVMPATLAAGCASSQEDQMEAELRDAEMAVAQGDMTSAKSIARHISDGKNFSGLSARQLGRLSLVYMQMADSADQSENVGAATECYRQAFATDADSDQSFYSEVGPEHTGHAVMLGAIVRSLDAPADSTLLEHEEPDSI